jgi:mannose-6-phosphate isomerase-like protein (cupin superfamily)
MGAELSTYVGHEKVTTAFAGKGGQLAKGPDFTASANKRTGPGQVEVHVKETDIFYIVDGEATFVTGGEMVGGKQSKENQFLGTDIKGGEVHHLAKGDVVTIPAGVPHWFKEVPKEVQYFVVKVLKP